MLYTSSESHSKDCHFTFETHYSARVLAFDATEAGLCLLEQFSLFQVVAETPCQ